MTFEPLRKHRWVYCLSEGSGEPIKIGVTQTVKTRLFAANCHTWRGIEVFWAVPGDVKFEQKIKDALRPHLIRNEWFRDEADAVKLAISRDEWRIGGDPWPHKEEFHQAWRKRYGSFPRELGFMCYESYCEERFYKHFNAAVQDETIDIANSLGVKLDPKDFRSRTYEPITGLIEQLTEPQTV